MTAESNRPGSSSNAIPITSLPVPELRRIRGEVEAEVQRLQSSKFQLQRVFNSFVTSDAAIKKLSQSKQGDQVLVPLTGSLYVPGRIASVTEVTVDVGTGYFVERTIDQAVDYCKRKQTYLSSNISALSQVLIEKQKALNSITRVLEAKIQEAQAQSSS